MRRTIDPLCPVDVLQFIGAAVCWCCSALVSALVLQCIGAAVYWCCSALVDLFALCLLEVLLLFCFCVAVVIIMIIIEVFIVSVIKINKIYCSLAQIGQSVCIFYFYLSRLCSVAFAYVG